MVLAKLGYVWREITHLSLTSRPYAVPNLIVEGRTANTIVVQPKLQLHRLLQQS